MYMYLLLLMYLLLIGLFIYSNEQNSISKKTSIIKIFYVVSAGFSVWLVMALRSNTVGTDLLNYSFEFYNSEFYLNNHIRETELGYSYFNNFFNYFGFSYQMYIALIAGIFVISISHLYHSYSRNMILSFYLHITIGLFAISMSGLRQTIAIALSMLAFTFLVKRKHILYFFIVGLAYLFHNSAIVFLTLYFLREIRITKKNGFIFLSLCLMLFVFKSEIATIIQKMSPEKYLRYSDYTVNINPLVIIVMIAIPLTCLIFWPNDIANDNKYHRIMSIFFVMSCANFVVYFFASEIPLFERLSLYFIVFNTILIPNIISDISNRHIKTLALLTCILLPLIQFLISTPGGSYGIDEYKFFWEQY